MGPAASRPTPCFSPTFDHKSCISPQWALPVLRVSGRRPSVAKNLYVGNLSYDASDSDLQRMFEEFGTVASAQVVKDRETGRSRGFGFVEMGSDQEAQAAINALNGKEVDGRALTVNEAKPRVDRGARRNYGGGRARGGHGGGRSGR